MPFVLLTGATRGIGQAAAVELARRGAEVALVGRDADRVRETAQAARDAGGGAPVHEHVADLERLDEVRRLAAEVLERHPRIDVLANNAGAMFTSRHVTADGLERTFALNHLAPFLLTNLLLDRLRESAPARVVTTASDAHKSGLLDLDDLESETSFGAMRAYGTTKLCNILFTRELARRVEGTGLTANCFHPGVVRTGFGKNDNMLLRIGITIAGTVLPLARARSSLARVAGATTRRRRSTAPTCWTRRSSRRARPRATTTSRPSCGGAQSSCSSCAVTRRRASAEAVISVGPPRSASCWTAAAAALIVLRMFAMAESAGSADSSSPVSQASSPVVMPAPTASRQTWSTAASMWPSS